MKYLDVKTKMSLVRIKALLADNLEILNGINEDDFKRIVLFSQNQKKILQNIHANTERGNIFMLLFFVRELVEACLHLEE